MHTLKTILFARY